MQMIKEKRKQITQVSNRQSRVISGLIILIFLIGILLFQSNQIISKEGKIINTEDYIPPTTFNPTPRIKISNESTPIVINGNPDFISKASSWNGTGTSSDPYVIYNLNITSSSSTAIEINNTDLYFRINNVHITVSGHGKHGIVLNNVSNAEIMDTSISGADYGIYVNSSTNITIDRNEIFSNNRGVVLETSKDNIIKNNDIHDNIDFGTYFKDSPDNQLLTNEIYSTGSTSSTGGIISLKFKISQATQGSGAYYDPSHGNLIEANNISFNNNYGLIIIESNNSIIRDNVIDANGLIGLNVSNSFFLTVEDNSITNNGKQSTTTNINIKLKMVQATQGSGAYYDPATNISFRKNLVTGNYQHGLIFENIDNSEVTFNNISYNGQSGILLLNSNNNDISDNNINGNGVRVSFQHSKTSRNVINQNLIGYGVYIDSSASNVLERNNFYFNTQFGVFALNSSSDNNLKNNLFCSDPSEKIEASDDGSNNIFLGNSWGSNSNSNTVILSGTAKTKDTKAQSLDCSSIQRYNPTSSFPSKAVPTSSGFEIMLTLSSVITLVLFQKKTK